MAPGPSHETELVSIPAGTFTMGTDDPRGHPGDGEGPKHEVTLDRFEMATTTVTNAQFAAFVNDSGHRTDAEQLGTSFVFSGLLPDDAEATRAVAMAPWWREVEGADWRHPEGPDSGIVDRLDHPVVHVSWHDAQAYCRWAGLRLPTEAEWEYGARGGTTGLHWWWGDELEPGGTHKMNVYQGTFPQGDTGDDGFVGTAPVKAFAPNPYGLYQVTGNVWEWCQDWFDPNTYRRSPARNPAGPREGTERVQRGGSYLCHKSYCRRYRVDSRGHSTPDSSAGHFGFRVARTP